MPRALHPPPLRPQEIAKDQAAPAPSLKLSVLYGKPHDRAAFEAYYQRAVADVPKLASRAA